MLSKRGLLFIISAPAGTGKTTLVTRLTTAFPRVMMSVSYTTRQPRPGEIQGAHYHFVSREEFEKRIGANEFLEYVTLYGDYYGTSKVWVKEQLERGKHVILTIDTQGALQLRNVVEAIYIFIKPPSLEVLRERLIRRKTESPEVIQERLEWAKKEMQLAEAYDYNIVNDDLDRAYEVLRCILIAEEHKV